ncbi:GyrI-like domain-containing protein [Streptomyces sp. NPDC007988]|uniref:GyrI-like domain-containing protein n=1 Tax=Streptomyces sp. NPDC007988 TaxID=3364802 RepID=UPI0036E1ED8D
MAVRRSVRMDGFAVIADRLPEIFGRPASHGTAPAGPPYFRFHTVDMAGESDVEADVPVLSGPTPEGDITVGILPAGRYGTPTHSGHPDKLFDAITRLREWAAEQGLEWDMAPGPDGAEHGGCRIESSLTDPRVEPDMERWETVPAFRLAD